MKTVRIVLDSRLLQAADQDARRTKRDRSALTRDALRDHLRRLSICEEEERDRRGYARGDHQKMSRSSGKRRRSGPPNPASRLRIA